MTLPGGLAGTDGTVDLMRKLAMGQYGSRSPNIRALAINILTQAGIAGKDYRGELIAIHNWVRDTIRYTRDVAGQETLLPPEETAFNSKAGDCLVGDTRLLTPFGFKAIQDVVVGDVIQGKDGWTTVTQWWDKGILPVEDIGLTNGGAFIATGGHRCFLLDGSEKLAQDLIKGDCLLGPAAIVPVPCADVLNDADAHFIGLYLADGWEDANRVCIAGKDGFAKEAQKRWVADYAQAKGWRTSWHPRYIRVIIPHDDPMYALIGTGALAPEKAIPVAVWSRLSATSAKRLLVGLLSDSHHPMKTQRALGAIEGRASKPRRSGLCYSTTSPELAKQVRLLFRMDGVSCKITKVVDHGGLGTHPVYRIYPRYFSNKPAKIKSISDAGQRHVYDIETKDHGIYLPDADVVVHNCDDMSVLEAALLGSVGFDTRFKTIGVTPDRFSHVYLEAKLNDQWVPLDPIMKDKPAGWEAPANMVKLVKTYPENTTEDLNMSRPVNGLGFIADQRVVSFLSPDPTEEYVPGSEDPNAGSNGPGNYVVMDSMLDSDLPIEALSNNAPAFPMNAHYDQMAPPVAQRRDPQLYRMRSPYDNGAPAPAWVYDRIDQETSDQSDSEDAAGNPVQGLGYDIMGPDVLGAMAAGAGRGGRQRLVKNPQRPALVQTPEGIDKMFSRSAQVMNGKAGDRILYQGLTSLAERPPIRPANTMAGLGGVFGVGRGNGPMPGINGMGVLAGRSMSGPGMGDLSDLADDTAAALPPATLVPAPVPVTGGLPKGLIVAGLAGLALAWYLKSRKTSAAKRFSGTVRHAKAKHRRSSDASSKDDFLLSH